MSNIPSILQVPAESELASGAPQQPNGQLLELRSETGTVYLRLSRWQGFRLGWAFRHFRKLPPELLSRRNQRLVEKLSRTAVVTPEGPIARNSILGVVEKVRPTMPAPGLRLVSSKTPAATVATGAKIRPFPGVRPPEPAKDDLPSGQWRALGTLACIGLAVILASAVKMPSLSRQTQKPNLPAAAPQRETPSPATAVAPIAEPPQRWIAPLPPETTMVHQELIALTSGDVPVKPIPVRHSPASVAQPPAPAPAVLVRSIATERAFVSALPQAPFARPVVPQRNLVGELRLTALIGSDGAVKEVTLVSGDPKLAKAGMRAVRQWHYDQSQMPGGAAEMETHIKMSFFGEDAVSIASIGKYN